MRGDEGNEGDEGYLAVMVLKSIQEDVGLAFEFQTHPRHLEWLSHADAHAMADAAFTVAVVFPSMV